MHHLISVLVVLFFLLLPRGLNLSCCCSMSLPWLCGDGDGGMCVNIGDLSDVSIGDLSDDNIGDLPPELFLGTNCQAT